MTGAEAAAPAAKDAQKCVNDQPTSCSSSGSMGSSCGSGAGPAAGAEGDVAAAVVLSASSAAGGTSASTLVCRSNGKAAGGGGSSGAMADDARGGGSAGSDANAATAVSDSEEEQAERAPPPMQRYYTDGPLTHWQHAAAVFTLLLFIAWIYVLAGLLLLAPFSRAAAAAAALAWSTLLLPCTPVGWRAFMANPVFSWWRAYFSFSILYEAPLDAARHCVYADFPHGAFPLSQLLGLTVRHLAGWDGERFYGMAADAAFRVPLWRHVYSWLGIVPASAANLKRFLKWGCVGLTPGGIKEMYMAGGDADHIFVRSRKGFVACAVENGAPIVPVYHFGNTRLLSFGPKWAEPYGRRWRFSLGLLFGRFGMPIPRRVPLMMVVGRPVEVGPRLARDDPAFAAAVDDAHARYMAALQRLYDAHKGCYGWAEHPLVMH